MATNNKAVVVCCDDLSINSYDLRSGARILPPLIIEDTASALCLSDSGSCMVLTKTGLLHLWDIEKKCCVISRASVRCLLSKKGKKRYMLNIYSSRSKENCEQDNQCINFHSSFA